MYTTWACECARSSRSFSVWIAMIGGKSIVGARTDTDACIGL